MGRKRMDPVKRFWNKVEKRDSGCWEWTASGSHGGYGQFFYNGQHRRATRFSWYLHTGKWPPDELFVCHKCDNPKCVNPACLFLGTQTDNQRDMHSKGRAVCPGGENHWGSKLRSEEVIAIRDFVKRNPVRGAKRFCARWFGVDDSCIGKLVRGERWSNGLQDARG